MWFIHLTVTTCHIQYTFLSLSFIFTRKRTKYKKEKLEVRRSKNGRRGLLIGAQSINTESLLTGIVGELYGNKKKRTHQVQLDFPLKHDSSIVSIQVHRTNSAQIFSILELIWPWKESNDRLYWYCLQGIVVNYKILLSYKSGLSSQPN